MASNDFEDAPFGIFKMGYSWITWLSTIGLVFLTVWTLWIMFQNTPAGTRRSQQMAEAIVTQTAIPPVSQNPCAPPRVSSSDVAVCIACHIIPGVSGGGAVGPDLTEIHNIAMERIESADYTGSATTAEEYIRESIYEPNAYWLPGDTHGAPGTSVMPERGGLPDSPTTDTQIEKIVAWLAFDPDSVCEEEVALR